MAVVLSSEDSSMFASSALRRSHSQPKFHVAKQAPFHSSSSATRLHDPFSQHHPVKTYSDSAPSSAPSSPRTTHAESTDLSWASTPASNLSIASDFDEPAVLADPDDHFVLPHYEGAYFPRAPLEDLEPPTSPKTGDSYTVSPADHDNSADTSRPGSPEAVEPASDDTALRVQPSRHVDYLSHNWREEDIWSSWRYIISRRNDYSNAARLENASWRTWMKAKNKLKTVSPETLNWLKDCDVTWLYGPLQTGNNSIAPSDADPNSGKLSRTNSFSSNKKPILKKRSMSEIMLARSLSNSSLVKQAAAAVQAQEKDGRGRLLRPSIVRATTDYVTFPFSSRRMSRDNSLWPSISSSGVTSPSGERRHIHFNEQVSQCIALDVRGDEEDDEDDVETERCADSDSDDGMLMMARTRRRKMPHAKRRVKRPSLAESRTIAMLPSTTLKYREDSPAPHETAMKHSVLRSPVISPSSSQETLKPSKSSKKFSFGDDEDDDDDEDRDQDDEDEQEEDDAPFASQRGWQSPTKIGSASKDDAANGKAAGVGLGLQRSPSTNSLNAEPAGMRRTASGMFMPYEEGESSATEGIFGRVIDTVNTARDIAHVIWNVGWRK